MRAINVKNPWATLIARGVKTLEVRTWRTRHRGPLLLVTSKRRATTIEARAIDIVDELPVSHAACLVDVVDCRPAVAEDCVHACVMPRPGDFVWVLERPRLVRPFFIRGQLSFFDVEDRLVRAAS